MKIEKVYEQNSYEFYKYSPSILKPFYINFEKVTLKRRLRLLIAYFAGYSVYYLAKGDKYIGYCLVQSGRDKRYIFSTDKDIIVGPYYIKEDYRGRKLSIALLEYVLNSAEIDYRNAYDYIQKENIPSIKASEAVGFEQINEANISKVIRRIKLCKKGAGDYLILKYSKS